MNLYTSKSFSILAACRRSDLPYEKFYAFAILTGYAKNRGRGGYLMDNIQVITKSANSIKYFHYDVLVPF